MKVIGWIAVGLAWVFCGGVLFCTHGCGGASVDVVSPDAGADCGPGHAGEIVCLGAHGG